MTTTIYAPSAPASATALATDKVLPRPVEPLPTPALSPASRKLVDKMVDQLNMGEEAAQALAAAVVDPSAVRRSIEAGPERLPVPGGAVLAVRAQVWSRAIMPDPRNPRISPSRRHPASGVVGKDERTRFAPLPEPLAHPDGKPELIQRLQNQEHLAWAAGQAREYVLSNNDWRESISNQGVMTETWVVATTFVHDDDTPDVTAPVTAEGSSRATSVHDLLGVRSADVPYNAEERRLRAHVRKLNEELDAAGSPAEVDPDLAVMLRCETMPALLLVGYEPHDSTVADFGVAVKSLVALRHVDYPKPWGPATENEALADAVIDELERRNLITHGRAKWISGELTPEEAAEDGFSNDAAIRCSAIVRLFTERDPEIYAGIRCAITTQSTRNRITTKLLFDIATSLILRSLPEEEPRRRERTRKYLKEAFGQELTREEWTASLRSHDEIIAAAEQEVAAGKPGPATRELAARGAYPLIVDGALTADRGSVNSDQPDRRNPGEVIDRMRTTPRGVRQLQQALHDFAAERRVRLIGEDGQVAKTQDGRDVVLRDTVLRSAYPRPGAGPVPVPVPVTTGERLDNALKQLATAVSSVEAAVEAVEAVRADDGSSAIDALGADKADCDVWRSILYDVLDKLPVWKSRRLQRNGAEIGEETDTDEPDDVDFEDDDLDLDDNEGDQQEEPMA
ncbi:hypothetical protein EV580_6540 [Mycobacterium sp. BK086]|uniref:hypothetical protein n=1 Tax=Mycobacterium sp. BK086 TaxID=2512165 RepID=UPI00105F6D94|nr:hypothetical protein [Mycobacterium sp. BK086]TDO06452.1 hypothetical protein EV580_6540 [Mycobacterium sp. BK086]